ncbi:MAG: cyanophycin synthetase [Alphaproteobacteria bacterium]
MTSKIGSHGTAFSTPLLGRLFEKLAPRIGAKVVFEPEWRIAGQITFANGKKRYFRYSSIDLNQLGSSEIAKDKDFANFFLKEGGYSTIPGKTFFSDVWAQAIKKPERAREGAWLYATQDLGLPVIVKPNGGSQGRGVAVVETREQFDRAMDVVFGLDRVALVQKKVTGQDYRIVVLDDEIISAYQRIPLNVQGDGILTISQLLEQKQEHFIVTGRDTKLNNDDPRIGEVLERQSLSFNSVPAAGSTVYLLDNANLSTGGDSVDVTADLHPSIQKLCVDLTRDAGLRLCGVDLMVEKSISEPLGAYWILEYNAAPGLDHYAQSGEAQQQVVEDLYLKVLESMGR